MKKFFTLILCLIMATPTYAVHEKFTFVDLAEKEAVKKVIQESAPRDLIFEENIESSSVFDLPTDKASKRWS